MFRHLTARSSAGDLGQGDGVVGGQGVTGPIGELEFLTKLQRILSEGQFVASYKYALLLALGELSVEKTSAPDGTLAIELDELAERFIALY